MSLIFPTDLGSNAQSSNFMGFQAFTVDGGLGSAKSDRSYIISGDPVFLPIPVEGVQDQYQNNWGASENISAAKVMMGQGIAGLGQGVSSSGGLIDKITNKIGGMRSSGADLASAGLDAGQSMWDNIAAGWDAGNMDALESGVMKGIKGASPFAMGAVVGGLGNAVVQSTGLAGFEETSVVYNGPQFRNFSFNFSLKPLTKDEQITIESIVEFFKMSAAPQEFKGTLYRIYSLPKVFEIKFYHKTGENQSLTKIGKCALTNIGIKYGGDRFQTFAAGHAPVQTDISLQFIELVLQTKNTMMNANEYFTAQTAAGMVDDFGAQHERGVAAAAAASAADASAAANVDNFGSYGEASRATATGGVDSFGSFSGGASAESRAVDTFSSGSAMGAVKSKARGGASFIPDGGAG